MEIVVAHPDRAPLRGKIGQVFGFRGLERVALDEARAGDIVQVTGVDAVAIGATLCAPEQPEPLPALKVDEPTLIMNFQVNTSPLAGRDGRFVTSRQLRERLVRFAALPLTVAVPSLPALEPGTRVRINVGEVDLIERSVACSYRETVNAQNDVVAQDASARA